MEPGLPVNRYRFGEYLLEAREARLLRSGADMGVQPKVIELLQTFVARPGHLFTRADLRRLLWPDVHVSDHSLSQVLHKARQALGEGTETEWIQTVHRRGYRFVGPVVAEVDETPQDEVAHDRFVGRASELAALAASWRAGAVGIALVGAGGAGKTRLAREHLRRFRGPWTSKTVIDLGAVRTGPALVGAVAASLGVGLAAADVARAVEQIGHALAHRGDSLVLLDDIEGVLPEAAAIVGAWRLQAPRVRWLITSRVRVAVDGVDEYEVPALDDADAVELFRERAKARAIDLGAGWNDEIRRLVRALEGSALGIELAAARTPMLDPAAIRARLDHQLSLLAGTREASPRHRGMRAAIAWSWDLATGPERAVLSHLALFSGPFTVPQAEKVAHPGPDAPPLLDVLDALSDRFLVETGARVDAQAGRLRLPPPVREFAREQLDVDDRARDRFVAAMRARAAEADAVYARWDSAAHASLLADVDHLRAATGEADRNPPARARLAIGTAQILLNAGRGIEAREAVHGASDLSGLDEVTSDQVTYWRATADTFGGAVSALLPDLGEVEARAVARGDRAFASRAAERRSEILHLAGQQVEAAVLGRRAMDHAADAGDLGLLAKAAYRTAVPTLFLGTLAEGREVVERGLAAARTIGDVSVESILLDLRGALALRSGSFDDATRDYTVSVALIRESGFGRNFVNSSVNLSSAHQEAGRFAEALAIQDDLEQYLANAGLIQRRGMLLCSRALTRMHLGELDGAGADLRAAQSVAVPGSQISQLVTMNLAAWETLRGRYAAACDLARTCAADCAGAPVMVSAALLWLVVSEAGRGDLAAARAASAEAQALGPMPRLVADSHVVAAALVDAVEARSRGDTQAHDGAVARILQGADAPVHALVALVARACRGVLTAD